jgi:diguanylate cyclase (GGDEF)-like protein
MLRPGVPTSLLTKFGVMSAIPIVLLGVALGLYLRAEAREDALADATRAAESVARMAIQPLLTRTHLAEGLDADDVARISVALEARYVSERITRVKLWGRDGRVLYSDDASLVGRRFPIGHELAEALEGRIEAEISHPKGKRESAADSDHGTLLEVYVPLRFVGDARPAGAFEVYLPYAPIADRIVQDTARVLLLLLAGLVVLYATLFRIVATASRRLRAQAHALQAQAFEKEHQALHDALTGLPNRTLFRDRVDQAVRGALRTGTRAAVLLIDLDRFKEINDTLGHHTGDALLKQVGPRLQGALRESDTMARLGGDEFAILLPGIPGALGAATVAEKLTEALHEPFLLEGITVPADASIGIALYPDHGRDADTLMQRADVAMYNAKGNHRAYAVYAPEQDDYSPDRLALVGELREAIAGGALVLHYQPKFDLRAGTLTGAEALVRWEHPTRGPIPPGDFIPLAEHTGLIRPLTLWVLDAALRQCRAWRDEGFEVAVAVNVSAHDLTSGELPGDVGRLLGRWGVPARALRIEITESAMMADPLRARDVLETLRDMGVALAVDDFGTGHSSLAYLKRLPVDELKIDRSFVINMASDENDAVIVRSTVALAHNLGLRVVAEGVETAGAAHTLRQLGCDLAQGYFYSRPLPPAGLTALLAEHACAAEEDGVSRAAGRAGPPAARASR